MKNLNLLVVILLLLYLGLSFDEAKAVINPSFVPWARLDTTIANTKISPSGRYMAFTDGNGENLQILDRQEKKSYNINKIRVGQSFFWSPDGNRLFFHFQVKNSSGNIRSVVAAYDCLKKSKVDVSEYNHRTGILTYDPRDYRYHLMFGEGIHSAKVELPDSRFAQWQKAQLAGNGRWLATQNGILWVTKNGKAMNKVATGDSSSVDSFSISPDGSTIAWATSRGSVYKSENGESATLIGHGKDPSWHPKTKQLTYAGARLVGKTIVNYDLRIVDGDGSQRWLTQTNDISERWPAWDFDGSKLIFTKENTSDLFEMRFNQ